MAVNRGRRRWLAIGTGVGVEVGAQDLLVAVVKVRPSGKRVLATTRIAKFAERPATEWGAEYAAFLRKAGADRKPATVILPRREVMVRLVALAGVADRDLGAAISYQLDSLHPYAEQEVAASWARLGRSADVLVGITRNETVERYANLFAEAGIRLAGFSFPAASLYSALRLHGAPPAGFFTVVEGEDHREVYGESPARTVYCGLFDSPDEAMAGFARGELRLGPEEAPTPLAELMGLEQGEFALAVAAATVSACPWLSLAANLLPVERRTQANHLAYVPTAGLAALAVAAFAILSAQGAFQDARFLAKLQEEVAQLQSQVVEADRLDKAIAQQLEKLASLDRFEQRTRADADALRETTALLAPPAWAQSLQLTRTEMYLQGQAEQAAGLLKLLDDSAFFHNSQFTQALGRVGAAEVETFLIRAAREGSGTGREPGGR